MVTADTKETKIEIVQGGGITSPQGFTAGGVHVGMRHDWTKLDFGLVYSETPCTTAAVYTSNTLKAAPLLLTREHLTDGKAQAIVANSGCANAATGKPGAENAVTMAKLAADKLGVEPAAVVVASTGVIGTQLPMNRIAISVEDPEGLIEALKPPASAAAKKPPTKKPARRDTRNNGSTTTRRTKRKAD